MGGSEQAAKDLETKHANASGGNSSVAASNPVGNRSTVGWCLRRGDDKLMVSEGCPPRDEQAQADSVSEGSWVWVTSTGEVGTDPSGAAGSWIWSSPSGTLSAMPANPPSGGAWYWVSQSGQVSKVPPDSTGNGVWLWLISPAQLSATPVPGSFWVPLPGIQPGQGAVGGLYYSPSLDGAAGGPIAGGSGALPKPVLTILPPPQPEAASSSSPQAAKDGRNDPQPDLEIWTQFFTIAGLPTTASSTGLSGYEELEVHEAYFCHSVATFNGGLKAIAQFGSETVVPNEVADSLVELVTRVRATAPEELVDVTTRLVANTSSLATRTRGLTGAVANLEIQKFLNENTADLTHPYLMCFTPAGSTLK